MAKKSLPPQDYLRQCFDYDPESGILTWRERPREHFASDHIWNNWNSKWANRRAGSINDTHWRVCIDSQPYYGHRVIWRLTTGVEPSDELDHRDMNGLDNRWNNLRSATRTQNQGNLPLNPHNKLGLRGVDFLRGKFRARISINGRPVHLGCFATAQEAKQAYDEAARQHFGEFTRL